MELLGRTMRLCLVVSATVPLLLALILVLGGMADDVADAFADAYVLDDVDALPTVDAAIVLGTAPFGTHGQRLRTLSLRLKTAYDLWSHGKARYLIVSGNRQDDGYDEPSRMRDGLVALGVPPEFVYRDPFGTRTWQSMIRVREVYGLKQVIVVSQRDHLARALFIGRHLGLDAWGYATEGTSYRGWRGHIIGRLSILRAWADLVFGRRLRQEKGVAIGVDPPN
jgi:SanA protein